MTPSRPRLVRKGHGSFVHPPRLSRTLISLPSSSAPSAMRPQGRRRDPEPADEPVGCQSYRPLPVTGPDPVVLPAERDRVGAGADQAAEAQLFYEFNLESHVPADHLLREIDRFLDIDRAGDASAALQPHGPALDRYRADCADAGYRLSAALFQKDAPKLLDQALTPCLYELCEARIVPTVDDERKVGRR